MARSSGFRSILRALPGAASLAGIVVGTGAIVGWALDIGALKSVLPGPVSMKPNTALAFIFASLALRLLLAAPDRRRGKLALAFAASECGIALLSLSEYAFGWNLGIDELIFRDPVGRLGISGPGRMAPATALGHLLLGSALVLAAARRGERAARFLAAFAALVALVPLVGYLYGLHQTAGLASATEGVAVHTAVLFLVLSIGLLLSGEENGLVEILTSERAAGVVARRIAPIAILMPLFLGWIRLLGERAHLYDTAFGASLVVASDVLVLGLLIWTNVKALHRADLEREQATLRLETSEERLRRSNRELDEFATVASHDLQEPLQKVQAFAARLRSRCASELPEEGKDYLERMEKAAARMQTLVRDLLLLARATTGKDELVPTDLSSVARDVLSDLELQIEATGARVEVGPLPSVEADPLQMRQLLQNLLQNALKFHKAGKPPSVRLRSEPAAPGKCGVVVEDDGIGFEPELAERIFVPFQRLNGRSEYPGTGIGLAICRRIVERTGGEISARGKPGEGAAFTVTLPLAAVTLPLARELAPPASSPRALVEEKPRATEGARADRDERSESGRDPQGRDLSRGVRGAARRDATRNADGGRASPPSGEEDIASVEPT
ncbi:hypothetical protein HY251_17705 [bacterium]|nr:hypothetical protein [bacterium]